MNIFIGIDPALDNTGIVVLNQRGDIPVNFVNIKTDSKHSNVIRWGDIAFDVNKYLKMFSSENLFTLVYEPFTIGKAHRNAMGYHVAVGTIFGIANNYGPMMMRLDRDIHKVLRQTGMGVPKGNDRTKKGKVNMAPFVRNYWPGCKNQHLADAWLAAKYLQVTSQ